MNAQEDGNAMAPETQNKAPESDETATKVYKVDEITAGLLEVQKIIAGSRDSLSVAEPRIADDVLFHLGVSARNLGRAIDLLDDLHDIGGVTRVTISKIEGLTGR